MQKRNNDHESLAREFQHGGVAWGEWVGGTGIAEKGHTVIEFKVKRRTALRGIFQRSHISNLCFVWTFYLKSNLQKIKVMLNTWPRAVRANNTPLTSRQNSVNISQNNYCFHWNNLRQAMQEVLRCIPGCSTGVTVPVFLSVLCLSQCSFIERHVNMSRFTFNSLLTNTRFFSIRVFPLSFHCCWSTCWHVAVAWDQNEITRLELKNHRGLGFVVWERLFIFTGGKILMCL